MGIFLKDEGIHHRVAVPHTPEQNGVAERKNRTLVESARCMLIESGLPSSFWAEAIATANHVENRCPTKGISEGTPFEKWFGKRPNISHLRIFGNKVFFLDKTPNKGKFDPRGIEGTFVGYSDRSKAYRIWSPKNRKIILSRDVKFMDFSKSESTFEDLEPKAMNHRADTKTLNSTKVEDPKFVEINLNPLNSAPDDDKPPFLGFPRQPDADSFIDNEPDFRGFDNANVPQDSKVVSSCDEDEFYDANVAASAAEIPFKDAISGLN